MPTSTPSSRGRRVLFPFITGVLALAVVEGAAWLITPVADRVLGEDIRPTTKIYAEQSQRIRELLDSTTPHRLQIDSILGWRYAPNFRDARDQLNAMALRSDREYAPTPPRGVLRVAAFGDSYVYGTEVDNANAWPTLMEVDNPRLEVLNYGVGGYGLDQAYLRYLHEGSLLSPQVVLLGFTEDDLRRVVNVYRRFISDAEYPLFKPRFQFARDGELVLEPAPVRTRTDYERLLSHPASVTRFGSDDAWYDAAVYDDPLYNYSAAVRLASTLGERVYHRYLSRDRLIAGERFNPSSTAFRIQMAIFRQFADSVRAAGRAPLVVVLPGRSSVEQRLAGQPRLDDPLLAQLKADSIPYLDAADAFAATTAPRNVARWFAPGGHYSPIGNRIVAAWLAARIPTMTLRPTVASGRRSAARPVATSASRN
ncbi:MAG TPA: SGNH/GDSL hydrolase family protein [Gemmatimonadaceae bacterium]|nr:SGNH/GDSL hydrolase family protein [Gemmatimonadaceae bacterium]